MMHFALLTCFFGRENSCFARVGRSLARCLFPAKRSEDLMQKIMSPVIFDTNCSFKQ